MPPGVAVFELYGSLFFGAVGKIESLAAQIPDGTRAVVLEMHRLVLLDTSGLDALEQLHATLDKRGIALVLAHVNPQPLSLIRRSGFAEALGPDQIVPTTADAFAGEDQLAAASDPAPAATAPDPVPQAAVACPLSSPSSSSPPAPAGDATSSRP